MDEQANLARQAASLGDLDQLNALLDSHGPGVARAEEDPEELTSLHIAAAAGQVEVVLFLLSDKVNADPQAARINNFTPLHSAAMQGHTEICQTLLNAGADPNIQTDPQGYAPLHSAVWGGHQGCVIKLLESGADKSLTNYREESPAETARRQGHDRLGQMIDQFH